MNKIKNIPVLHPGHSKSIEIEGIIAKNAFVKLKLYVRTQAST